MMNGTTIKEYFSKMIVANFTAEIMQRWDLSAAEKINFEETEKILRLKINNYLEEIRNEKLTFEEI